MTDSAVAQRRRPSWIVSLLSLVILLPVGWTVSIAARFAWNTDVSLGIRAFAGAYAVLGVVLMVRRVRGVWRERRTGVISYP